jgi:hypothetical protein
MPAVHDGVALQGWFINCACWASTQTYEHSQIDRRREGRKQRRSLSPLSCACLAGSTVRGHPRLCARVLIAVVSCCCYTCSHRRGFLFTPFFLPFWLVGCESGCGCDTEADTKLSEARQERHRRTSAHDTHTREIASERGRGSDSDAAAVSCWRSADTGSHHCHRRGQHRKTAAMEEQDRITITICGDGGCGTPPSPPRTHSLSSTQC